MNLRHRRARLLWSALRYPALPLERLGTDVLEEARPRAVTTMDGSRAVVLQADRRALELGVVPGLALSGARALAPDLFILAHDPSAQRARLEQLALGAYRYSSRIVLAPPETVLLESGGSQRLFGGIGALLDRMRADADVEETLLVLGTAPTPSAAVLLARAGDERPVRTLGALHAALAPLPLDPLALERRVGDALTRSGIRTLGQLLALPPASLTRRFGHRLVDTLYRLDGRLPDPRVPFRAPPRFAEGVELPLEATSTPALAFALRRLIAALGGYLQARDLGIAELAIVLRHRRRPPSPVRVRFGELTGDAAHIARVASGRLERLTLAAPVTHLTVEAHRLGAIERGAPTLLDAGGSPRASRSEIDDTLAARLGEQRLYRVHVRDEHRPEASWGRDDDGRPAESVPWPARPLWLLPRPEPAPASLEVASAPERIESGWWDRPDARRDYFIARDERGVHYWVFRDRRAPETLWLHGLFA